MSYKLKLKVVANSLEVLGTIDAEKIVCCSECQPDSYIRNLKPMDLEPENIEELYERARNVEIVYLYNTAYICLCI